MKKVFFLIIFVIPLLTQAQSKIKLIEDAVLLRKEILSHIPIGTDTITAKKIMQKNKFKCTMMRKEKFADGYIIHENVDFIHCERSTSKGLIEKRWQVILVHQNGKVTEEYVTFGLIGP